MQKSLTTSPPARHSAPRQPRKPKAEHLCMAYPAYRSQEDSTYWLASYLHRVAEHAALQSHFKRSFQTRGPGTDTISQNALSRAIVNHEDQMTTAAKYARDDGLLLYAWPGTTFFDSAKLQ